LNAEIEKCINVFKLNYFRRLLWIHYTLHTSIVQVRELDTATTIVSSQTQGWVSHHQSQRNIGAHHPAGYCRTARSGDIQGKSGRKDKELTDPVSSRVLDNEC
jgi:hypothetical protein